MRTGIIGYGSMGKMLLKKFSESGRVSCDNLFISSRTLSKIEEVPDRYTICRSNTSLAESSDIIIICTRPNDILTVLKEIVGAVSEDAIIISLNGSVTFDSLEKISYRKYAKVIPSVTAEINRSQTLVSCNRLVSDQDRTCIRNLFSCLGDIIELPENEMGMGSELVSCMPGFIASIFDVICRSAQKHTSIPQEQIINMVLNTLGATAELMLQKDMSFTDIVNRVATKGGITEVGTRVIYDGFPDIAEEMYEKTLAKRRETASMMKCFKLEIFIPETHFADLREVLQSVDAGHIGSYDCCLSYSKVIGTWRPLANTSPFIGKENEISEAEELKVEVTVRGEILDETLKAIKAVHPYEEPVINVIELYRTGL
ncbi:MAG: NAD(P)-binding domain-containing protein [Anaerolineaceae bacterium]|nr:NAD(P)-binding domain-containing protein [Anaerolineaceae bacterium]